MEPPLQWLTGETIVPAIANRQDEACAEARDKKMVFSYGVLNLSINQLWHQSDNCFKSYYLMGLSLIIHAPASPTTGLSETMVHYCMLVAWHASY